MNDALVPSNVQTLERLMSQYGDGLLRMCYMMLRMCYMMLRDHELARDATQDCFLKVYRALDTFHEGHSEKAWLMRIAVNTCRDLQRSRWWRFVDWRVTLDDLPEPGASDEYPDPTVLTAVMNLPDKYRRIVLLHYYQGMSLIEIAQTLDVPPATVRTQLRRAKDKLRGHLERWYLNEE